VSRRQRAPVWPRRIISRTWEPCPLCGLLVRRDEFTGELLGQPPFPNSSSPIHDCRALSHDRAHDQQEQETKR